MVVVNFSVGGGEVGIQHLKIVSWARMADRLGQITSHMKDPIMNIDRYMDGQVAIVTGAGSGMVRE